MKTNDSRLVSAMRKFSRRTLPPEHRPRTDTRDWQKLMESELDALSRRMSAVESRMTVMFYLVVILTITTIVSNADAAQQLLRGVLQFR